MRSTTLAPSVMNPALSTCDCLEAGSADAATDDLFRTTVLPLGWEDDEEDEDDDDAFEDEDDVDLDEEDEDFFEDDDEVDDEEEELLDDE